MAGCEVSVCVYVCGCKSISRMRKENQKRIHSTNWCTMWDLRFPSHTSALSSQRTFGEEPQNYSVMKQWSTNRPG